MADIDNLSIKISASVGTAVTNLNKLKSALSDLNTQLDRLDPSRLQGVSNAANTMNTAVSGMQKSTKELGNIIGNIGKNADNIAQVGQKAQNAGNLLQGLAQKGDNASRSIRETGKAAESSGSGGFQNLSKQISKLGSSLMNSSSYLKSAGSLIKGYFTAITAPIRGATRAMQKFGKSNNFATKTAKSLVKELTRVGKMLKLMVTRMALRAVIKEVGNGFKSLALHSEEFNKSVSGVMNGAKQLGYSFAAMVSPLINAFAPAIKYVINLLIKLANIINQVFSALTGAGTWNKAKEFTDDWANDIKAANKEAKQLKKTVLGFDELNQMQEKQTSGGDTSGNILDMFETKAIDSKWKDLADWLKQMWKLGDFYDLGKKIGEKLRDMLESIPWEQIRKTANKLGGALATLINGFVEVERLGYDIGKTIAQSINTVFEFLNGFVHKLHWDSIGKFIAETFNGFFENIDWALIKDTIVTGMAGLAEALQTFIDNFNWDNISHFVINGIDTVTAGIKAFIDGVDWLDLGVKIGDQINKVLEGVNWREVGETLGGILEAAIDWAYGLVTTFSVDDAVKAIEDFLDGVCASVNFQRAGETLGTAIHKLIKVIQDFWANEENRKKIKTAIFDFFEGIFNSMTESDFAFIATTAGALALLSALGKLVGNYAPTITLTLAVAWAGYKLGGLLGKWLTEDPVYDEYDIGAVLKWTVDNFPTSLDDAIEKLGELRQAWWDMLYDMDNVVTKVLAVANLIANPSSWPQFLGRFAKDKGWSGIDIGGAGGSGANAEADEWQKTIEAAKEATDNAIRYKSETLPLWNGSGGSGANIESGEWEKTIEAASEASKMTYTYKTEAQDAASKTKNLWSSGAVSTRDYSKEVEGLTEKQKQLKGIMSPLAEDTKKVSDNTAKLSANQKTQNNDAKNLTQALNNANNAYKNVNTSMKGAVEYTPVLTKAQQEIADNYTKTGESSEKFGETTTKVWGDYDTVTANSASGFDDTMNEIQKSMGDCSNDLVKQTGKIFDSFSKDKWTFKGVWEGLEKTFKEAKSKIGDVWNSIAEKLNGEYEIGGGKFNIKLPRFANGGFPENGLFLANSTEMVGRFSNGRTAVANNEMIVEGISAGVYNAVASAMSRSGSSNNGYIANTIVVDGEVIARTVTKAQQKQGMRYSPVMG